MVEILVLEYCRQTETVFKTRISRQAEARQTHGRDCAGRHAQGFHDHRYCSGRRTLHPNPIPPPPNPPWGSQLINFSRSPRRPVRRLLPSLLSPSSSLSSLSSTSQLVAPAICRNWDRSPGPQDPQRLLPTAEWLSIT